MRCKKLKVPITNAVVKSPNALPKTVDDPQYRAAVTQYGQEMADQMLQVRQAPRKAAKKQNLEMQLVNSILQIIPMRYKIYLFRNNSGALETQGGRYVRFGEKGSPDVLGFQAPNGRFIGIECKSPTGKCSAEQVQWLLRAAADGALVGVVRSIKEVEEMLTTGNCRIEELG